MTKTQLLKAFGEEKLRLTMAKLLDKAEMAKDRDIPSCSVFLTEEEGAEGETLLQRFSSGDYVFFGGYEGASRKIFGFLPSWMEEETWYLPENVPICALSVTVAPVARENLGHSDYLGSLMGIGLQREKFGDILLTKEGCQLILLRESLSIVLDQWEKVGRHPVSLREISLEDLEVAPPSLKAIQDTVASLRMDAVVASGLGIPRNKAALLISGGKVLKNHKVCDKVDGEVSIGDVFSSRGLGKFVLAEIGGASRKGRTIIKLNRYV